MADKRTGVRDERQEKHMKKIEPEYCLLAFGKRFQNPMIPHPENHNYDKTDEVGNEIRNLIHQISQEFGIADIRTLGNFEVQN